MAARQAILRQLIESRNAAAERAVELALIAAEPAEQSELADALLERNRRPGWVTLIRAFDRLAPDIQNKLLARPRDLFGPLAETMQDSAGAARENVITIVGRCADTKLVYLLAEALMDARPEVRELAGQSLLNAVRRYCDSGRADASPPHPDDGAQLRRAVEFALHHFRNHRQSTALLAGLIFERQQDAPMWACFQDTYDELTRAATVILRAPPEPALARALLLALASSLKAAAMAGLAGVESPVLAGALARESFRLIDPLLREGARSVTHLKMLPAVRKDPPWKPETWLDWLRLIESVGMQTSERLTWLQRMLEAAPAGPEGAAWRISLVRAIADTALPSAGLVLARCTMDSDEHVARSAARYLLGRRQSEWREFADAVAQSPHPSVRRLVGLSTTPPPRSAPAAAPASPATRQVPGEFDKTWKDFQKLPPAVQHSAARATVSDPALAEHLKTKLGGASPTEIAQALRMLGAAHNLAPFRAQIIALCGHIDPRIAAMAVRLIGRLADARLKDLLEAAANHSDARVRANAIESMTELHIADRSQQVLAMINSRHNRERANAIRAISQFDFATARECLVRMLADPNPMHRMSALWVVGQLNLLEVMRQVSMLGRRDPHLRVRKRAAEMLESVGAAGPVSA